VYRFVEHTAEVQLELDTATAEEAFRDALAALAELIGPGDERGPAGSPPVERTVSLAAGDLPALLAAWLEELLYLSETEGLVPEGAELELAGTRLDASVRFREAEPRPLVKAVTYHDLELAPTGERWHGQVVLDV
jgi:SHS2 domain-containing protein